MIGVERRDGKLVAAVAAAVEAFFHAFIPVAMAMPAASAAAFIAGITGIIGINASSQDRIHLAAAGSRRDSTECQDGC
jgi:hypothetical protein